MKNLVSLNSHNWVWPSADQNSWNGQYEYINLHRYVMEYVKDRSVMVQAGGNCGLILNTFVEYFDTVYTFEPDPVNFYCLTQNIVDPKVIKMQACLGYDNKPVAVQQLVREGRPHDTGGVHVMGHGRIPSISIDNLNLSSCGLIQLDVEGYELNALRGAVNTIKSFKPVLCVELCEKWLNRYNNTSNNVIIFLEDLGYTKISSYGVDSIFVYND